MKTPKIELNTHLQDHWTEKEKENVSVVVDFFQKLMNEHNFEYTLETYGGGSYLQHNRAIPNDISGLVRYVKNMTKRYPEYSFDVKRVYADDEYVVMHSQFLSIQDDANPSSRCVRSIVADP